MPIRIEETFKKTSAGPRANLTDFTVPSPSSSPGQSGLKTPYIRFKNKDESQNIRTLLIRGIHMHPYERKRRTGWWSTLVFILFLSPLATAEDNRPNIVYILADDLGYGEIQVYNPKKGKIPTPNVDRLAEQGMMFTDAHSGSSVCTPTRYGVLTGRYAWRSPLQSGVVGPGGHPPLIDSDRLTVPRFLSRHEYHTACIGKWHLGFRYEEKRASHPPNTAPAPVGSRIIGGPTTRGFDEFYGFPLSRTMRTLIENDRVVVERPLVKILPNLTLRAVEYIRKRAEDARDGSPFFLYFSLNSPHSPVVPSERFQGKSGLNKWADYVMETDWAVGQVLKVLKQTGLREDTLVIFTSDNGTSARAANADQLEKKGHYPSAHLRGYKTDIWEGGHRIPFIARWPGVIKPGTTSSRLISLNDLFATTADQAKRRFSSPDNPEKP